MTNLITSVVAGRRLEKYLVRQTELKLVLLRRSISVSAESFVLIKNGLSAERSVGRENVTARREARPMVTDQRTQHTSHQSYALSHELS